MVETHKSFCRFCHVFCGVEVDVDDGRVVEVRGDFENEVTRGYTCPKGRAEVERIHHPDRLLAPLKRGPGGFSEVAPRQALDEISERLGDIIARHGPNSVAVYVGCGGHRTSAGGPWFVSRWLRALGSERLYTSFTIDSPSLSIAANRFFGGPMPLNLLDVDRAQAVMFVGTNPVTSHQLNMPQSDPFRRVTDARKRGAKLIVVDPRRSDAARIADVHLQVKPGEDATLLAGIVKIILDRRLFDADYVAAYASGVEALHQALADFDLPYVEQRTGVPAALVEEAAVLFATANSGGAQSGTGLHMAGHHNLTTQLVMTLNGLCGRYDRAGGMVRNEGPLGREFGPESGPITMPEPPKSRIRGISAFNGLFGSYFEMPTSTLTDEILTPGDEQIRALIVNGGNPALVFAEESSTLKALDSLELLVVNDLFRSATAEHADYVMAVKHPFERVDIPKLMDGTYPFPFSQYADKIIDGPEGCLEEWEIFWELAMRLGLPLRVGSLTAEHLPTTDELLDAQNRHSRVPLDEIRQHPGGKIFGEAETRVGGVIPNMIGHADRRMALGHPEVLAELREVRAESGPTAETANGFEFRMITYRMKEVYCTQGQNLPSLRRRRKFNPVLMHPDAMRSHGFAEGDVVHVESAYGEVEGIVEASETVQPDVIAFAFGWGNPADSRPISERGSNVQRLIPDGELYDSVTGLARQSALPVNVSAVISDVSAVSSDVSAVPSDAAR